MSDTSDTNEWRKKLSPDEYQVCREKGTEQPFSGKYWDHWEEGAYRCTCCDAALFESDSKFDAGCGWPSFSKPTAEAKIKENFDDTFGMRRTEVTCHNCGSHLGHVFTDGPAPTGLRYCINSVSIKHEND